MKIVAYKVYNELGEQVEDRTYKISSLDELNRIKHYGVDNYKHDRPFVWLSVTMNNTTCIRMCNNIHIGEKIFKIVMDEYVRIGMAFDPIED